MVEVPEFWKKKFMEFSKLFEEAYDIADWLEEREYVLQGRARELFDEMTSALVDAYEAWNELYSMMMRERRVSYDR